MRHLLFISLGLLTACQISLLSAAERVALLIGNNAYQHAKPLTNPLNDVAAVGERLEKGGWKVSAARDVTVLAMRRAVREFCEKAAGADAAMVFFAGHGIEVRGRNYLLPVDAKLSEEAGEDGLPLETLALDDLLSSLGKSGAKLKIVVLDSCRDNPLSRSWLGSRSSGGGLAAVGEKAMGEGTMLVFSTAPGKVAADGAGTNSPFTTALMERMERGGGMVDVFGGVALAMGPRQEAWISFDGSGRSLVAFRNFPLFPGGGPVLPHRMAPEVGQLPERKSSPLADHAPEELPERITLRRAVKVFDSSSSAALEIPGGSQVKFVRLHEDKIVISPGSPDVEGIVLIDDTDILEQIWSRPLAVTVNPAIVPMDPELAPAGYIPLSREQIIGIMRESLRAKQVVSINFNEVSEWSVEDPEELHGDKFNVGVVTYTAKTFLGPRSALAKAYISGGRVYKWTNPKSGTEIK